MTSANDPQWIAFWTALAEAAPHLAIDPQKPWEKTFALALGGTVKLTLSLSQDRSSVYLVGRTPEAQDWIAANKTALATRLRTTAGAGSGEADKGIWFRKDNRNACFTVRRQWPKALRWFPLQHALYSNAVKETEAEQ